MQILGPVVQENLLKVPNHPAEPLKLCFNSGAGSSKIHISKYVITGGFLQLWRRSFFFLTQYGFVSSAALNNPRVSNHAPTESQQAAGFYSNLCRWTLKPAYCLHQFVVKFRAFKQSLSSCKVVKYIQVVISYL